MLIEAEDEESKALCAKLSNEDGKPIHRTELWRYATGRVTPSAERASLMHHLTGGRIAAHGWEPEGTRRVEHRGVAPRERFRGGRRVARA